MAAVSTARSSSALGPVAARTRQTRIFRCRTSPPIGTRVAGCENVGKASTRTRAAAYLPETPSSSRRLGVLVAPLILGVSALVACGSEGTRVGAADPVDRAIQPIISGTASGAEQDAIVIVAQFSDGGRRGLCSGTLIAPNLVLTARHCVSDTDSVAGCGTDGAPVVGAMLHGDRPASELYVFAGKAGVATAVSESAASARAKELVVPDANTICNHDVAFIVLDRDVEGAIAPIRIGKADPAETLTAVGWGITEAGTLPTVRQQRSSLTFLGNGPMPLPADDKYGIGDAEFMVGESACAGDSGSPILSAKGAVVGVASRAGNGKARDPNNIASTCMGETAHAVYTQLESAKDLVEKAFATAKAKPWLEGETDPRAKPADALPDASVPTQSGTENKSAPPQIELPKTDTPAPEAAQGGCAVGAVGNEDAARDALGIMAGLFLIAKLGRRLRFRRA